MISNIEATVRTYRLKMLIVSKYLEAIGAKRKKMIRLCCESGFSDATVFFCVFQDASANELQRARRNLWEQQYCGRLN